MDMRFLMKQAQQMQAKLADAQANLREWGRVAARTGATGYLNTDWGDDGHLNCISYSYWSFAYGADRAWRNQPDEAAEQRFDERFLAQVLPPARRPRVSAARTLSCARSP